MSEAADSTSADRSKQRLLAGWSALLAAASALATVHPEFETDPFWQLTLGRAVVEHRSRTVPEPVALPAFSDPNVVQEWLWNVVAYLLHRLGPGVLAAFVAVLGATAAVLVVRLVASVRRDAGPGAIALVSGLVVAMVMMRMRARPEAMGLVLLPAFMLTGLAFRAAEGRRRVLFGAALAALAVVWAQAHGSFVLAPALYVALVGPSFVKEPSRAERRTALAVFGLLLAALATSAEGLNVVSYVLAHGGGDAKEHIVEWRALRFADLDPTELDGKYGGPYGPATVALWMLSLAGMLVGRRLFVSELLLAGLGAVLLKMGCRFLTPNAILVAPLAVSGAVELGRAFAGTGFVSRLAAWCGAAGGAFACLVQLRSLHLARGPLGRLGLAEGSYPVAAAEALRRRPAGALVLSTYDAGGPLGLWLGGHARTYVDSRTPAYFDDTDFGLARDIFAHPDALARAVVRYRADALVILRHEPACASVPAGFVPIAIEPRFTTFVRGGEPLTALAPCGSEFVPERACADGGASLARDLARLAALGETPFVRFLRAQRILRCGGRLNDAEWLIPPRDLAMPYRAQRDLAMATFLLRTARAPEAVREIQDAARAGDVDALSLVGAALLAGAIPLAQGRALLEGAARELGDRTPPELRALLSMTCAELGDARCARFHGVRAAAAGARGSKQALTWLAREGSSPRIREDAAAWLEVLAAEGNASP